MWIVTTGLWDGGGGGAVQGLVAQLIAERDASSSPAGSPGDSVFGTVILTPTRVTGERGLHLVSLGQRGLVEQVWKQAGCIHGDETWAQGARFLCLPTPPQAGHPQSGSTRENKCQHAIPKEMIAGLAGQVRNHLCGGWDSGRTEGVIHR